MSPAGRERLGRWIAVLVASLAAHLIALSALDLAPRAAATSELNAIDVSFSVLAPPPPAVPTESRPIESRAAKNTALSVPVVASRRSRSRSDADRPPPPKPAPASATTSQGKPMLALDPASVARAFVLSKQTMPSEASETGGDGSRATEGEDKTRNYFEGVGDKPWLSVRDPPSLKRHQDGTHHYQGHAFKAIVERDGSVTFDDGYGQGVTVNFDITDLIMRRHGEDPYRVEKNWFLEGTAKFRQDLFEHWRAKQILLALRKLRVRLLHVSEDETLSDRQKATRIVAMFEDTADDEAGVSARDTIAEFVADRMPNVELPSYNR